MEISSRTEFGFPLDLYDISPSRMGNPVSTFVGSCGIVSKVCVQNFAVVASVLHSPGPPPFLGDLFRRHSIV